ncbi:uncharacterized protein LOC132622327 isoform X2 [Lycium barbarum]|uniref:uncharacterized protein LOC132622327 isoform X2 n=1 Tax=Lycium barbarum TaxID=112863 RepID=UPI00293E44A2|nr:uncharacterized protein LOC132622327 isoform X2 [Lycium barbarum]
MEMDDSRSILLEDFGQKVDLTRRIREVLLNYPEGTTVLKELIQNADDAGATKVCLCLDRRNHGTESLLSDKLAQWQGPALLAYNDAVFSEDDFVSISRIGGSSKHGQAWKTGRFGVGFNSVYHLTDLPSFVSGKYVVLFDPQGVYLPNVSASNPGKRIDYVSSSAISLYKDQFSPYCAFGCDMKSPLNGTLFRFPLRNADQAAISKLSKQGYLEDDISSMLVQLYEEGVFSLLFLKSVLSIEMYEWDVGLAEPRKTYSCSVNSDKSDTIWHRQALLKLSKLTDSNEPFVDTFSLEFLSEAVNGSHPQKRTDRFYIVQRLSAPSSRIGAFAAKASKDFDIHLLPWASVAACISDNSSKDDVLKQGRAFCFLPLPVKTGLNAHINGFFEVSSNRRGIWYGADMDRSGRIRSLWNRLLLEDVVAPNYAQLLLGAQQMLGPTETYYSLWPTGSFEEPWNILVEHIYQNITEFPVFYSNVKGGNWISAREAFLHDSKLLKSKELEDALVQLGMPVVCLPNGLFNMLVTCVTGIKWKIVTPDSVRHYLRESKSASAIDRSYRLMLLEYCLEDLVDTDVGIHAFGVPLLPLANGDFGLLSEPMNGISYFICNDLEYTLLRNLSDRVIDRKIPCNLLDRLTAVAKASGANLSFFSVPKLLQVIPKFFPAEWKYKTNVLWDPGSCSNHPTLSWFALFWRYLRDQCAELSLFGDWPILPSTSGHLYRPSRHLKLLNAENLSDKMQHVLIKIGCKILDCSHDIQHPDLSDYVCDADAGGVLKSIFDVVSSSERTQDFLQHLEVEERDELRGFLLDPRWYISNCMDVSNLCNCKRLPVYRVYGREQSESIQFSDLVNPQKYLPPLDCSASLLSAEFINSSSNTEEEVLNRYLGVERMRKADFYNKHVLDRVNLLDPDVRDNIMIMILRELPHLCVEDAHFKANLRNLEFIPTSNGSMRSPSVLYDPRNEELYALLEDCDSFPYGAFQESGILDILRGLGLRTTVSTETVIQSARRVEKMMHTDPETAHSRGKVLLSYLEVNALKWLPDRTKDDHGTMNRMFSRATNAFKPRHVKSDLEKFWSDLRLICWCPVLVSSPYQSLPWPAVSSMVAPPKLVRLYSDLWLVSASMRILDGECSSSALSNQLGWSSPPAGSVIAAQLLELGKNSEIVTDPMLREELALAMPRIYSILMSMLASDEIDIVKAVLEGCRWIWVGDGFATTDEVVLNGPLHLAPYMRVVPVDLAVFKELFLELGIREFLCPNDYANILNRMAIKKGSLPLDTQEIRAAILIAQHLSEVQFSEDPVKIYLPDVSCRLLFATDLVYNDAPWLLDSEDPSSSFGSSSNMAFNASQTVHRFVHGNISNDVAEKLGVRSLRRILLAESADSMNLSLSGAAEAFGQHEALTTRLKHILEMYADGPGTLFELVQNAADANASKVIFLLDKTQYGTSSVLSPEMADWQGPALYCFNDSVFTPQDLYAISRIGQETKLEKPFAIGRFGLGFNCVYHFTDIPTFVSGENIVMFDPHACHLPGISPSHPGLRIKFAGRRILEQFPDQFSPFLHFGCDLQHSFPGTLFRFPLRSENVASRSQIKKEGYTPDDVLALFHSFSEVVSETLLFLRNVKSISIFVKEGANSEMQVLHCVDKQYVGDPEDESNPNHQVFSLMYGKRHEKINKAQFLNQLCKSVNIDLPWKCHKIVVSEKSPSGSRAHLWLTSECLGFIRGKNSHANLDKYHKTIPWACVATCLHTMQVESDLDGDFDKSDLIAPNLLDFPVASAGVIENFEGRAFCFLPLPVITGLPVHVNAYFELSSNRRDIWFGNDMAGGGKKRSEWNMYLLEDVVAPAYGYLLEKVASEIGPCDSFFSFWPTKIGYEPWASVVRKLYNFISDSGLKVLYTKARGGQWISTKQAIFPDFTFDKARELVDALSDAGLPLATIPEALVEKFKEICPGVHFLTPQLLRTLLIRRNREFRDRNAMILTLEYCLLDLRTPVQSSTYFGLPLIPLSNGLFTKFQKRGESDRIYIAHGDGYGLLKDSLPHQLVDSGISAFLYDKLCEVAQSEDFNITFLTCPLLERLCVQLLPADWQLAKQVNWVPGCQGHPDLEWMRLLWSYLKSCCDDLSLFSKWPILPVLNNRLLQLVENSNVIKDGGWSENMSSLLLRVGCLILTRDLPIDHPHLMRYVQPPTASGILNAMLAAAVKIEKIEGLFTNALEGEMHELRSYILQSKWFCEDSVNSTQMVIIKEIPMFESFKSRKMVSLSRSTKWLKPNGVHEDLLNDDFLRIESDKERIILNKYLEVAEPTKADFIKHCVITHMSEFVSQDGLLSSILQDIKYLMEEDGAFKEAISKASFVLTRDGSWKDPIRLYDPRIPELEILLHGGAFFPSEKFSSPEFLEILVNLGLRQSLSFTGLLDCATSVALLHNSEELEAVKNGSRLLYLLDTVASKLASQDGDSSIGHETSQGLCLSEGAVDVTDNLSGIISFLSNWIVDMTGEEFWSALRSISWCPVLVDPPIRGLPWLASRRKIAMPINVRPKSQMWMVSSKMHILDGECSEHLQHKLGWMDSPSIEILSEQLLGLSKFYVEVNESSDVAPNFDSVLQEQVLLIYSQLQEFIGSNDFEVLKSTLDGARWVWIGDDFVSPAVLAFDSPVKFSPYLYVVPSELTDFTDLLVELGVRLSFDVFDYFHVLQTLQNDVKGYPLSADQLSFVNHVLEAIADCNMDSLMFEASSTPLLLPDSSGVLMSAGNLVYNDAPWMESNTVGGKRLVHPSISQNLAERLGVQSLRSVSLVSEEMTKDLPCMDYTKICELLELYGKTDFLLYDLLELADCCKAKKLHLIFDRREHQCQSLLQHNLGDFQGPALVVILEGANLSRDEVAGLQFLPPWSLRGDTMNYGLGLLSCFSISDFVSVVSDGFLYMFDPKGLALAMPSHRAPAAKMFSLRGTNLTERFRDQFSPLLIDQNVPWSLSNSTVIRMPFSPECMKDGLEVGLKKISMMLDKFLNNASATILFLKSVLQISLSIWEQGSPQPSLEYSVDLDPLYSASRNPFSEKKWKKFQLSSLFSSSNSAIKLQVIDVNFWKQGTKIVDRWLVVLSLGSGQTRNMALDRRYMAYNLTPVGGVAVLISKNGQPSNTCSSSFILSPLPLSSTINIPVTILGYFLVCHNQGRFVFKDQEMESLPGPLFDVGNQLIEAWNRELMCCVRDSYVKLVLEMQKLRREPSTSLLEPSVARAVSLTLNAYGDQIYSFWPRSTRNLLIEQEQDGNNFMSVKVSKADWECITQQVIQPFYARLMDLPVWQLYSGNLVKAEEGMFLSQPGTGVEGGLLPATVCAFVKEHYPVFSVPWELVSEIQALGVTVREIKPRMVRDLLRASSTSIVLRSVETYIDVLEYCLSDIQLLKTGEPSRPDSFRDISNLDSVKECSEGHTNSLSESSSSSHRIHNTVQPPSSSGGDALEMMTSLGKALFDLGRVVVEDIGRGGGPLSQRNVISGAIGDSIRDRNDQKLLAVASELRGLPCPTGTNHLTRLGATELWVGNKDQQSLMISLAAKFIHPKVLERSILLNICSNSTIQSLLKLQSFSLILLANHMRFLFHENWVNHVVNSNMAPWFSWENNATSASECGPSPNWIRLFWKMVDDCSDDLALFADWPLIPAFLGRPVLCCVKERKLVFIPPIVTDLDSIGLGDRASGEADLSGLPSESEEIQSYRLSFKVAERKYPWLTSFLNQCNIPVFDTSFLDCAGHCKCLPSEGQSLGQVIASKLVAAKNAGYFPELTSFPDSQRDELFTLFASDFSANSSGYGREELEVLRDLPIYMTVVGTYTRLHSHDLCMIPSNTFLKPFDERCLSVSPDSNEKPLFRALGVPELHDQQIFVKFGLPRFDEKPQSVQEDILIYLYSNWQYLQEDSSIIEVLKETKFVRSADEMSAELFKPNDLFDPSDALLTSVFSGMRIKFPGERFISEGWLRILKKAGLHTSAESDVILECAKRVESLGRDIMPPSELTDDLEKELFSSQDEVSFEIWLLAESLVKAIISNFAVLYSNHFCSIFGKIACVPAEKGLPNMGGKRSGKRVLCSYSEAIILKDWPLAWSCAPILSRQSIVPPEYSWGALNLRSPPACPTVLRHLEVIGRNSGEDTLAHWPATTGIKTIDEASFDVLKYLDRVWSSLSSSDKEALRQVAFMPAANGTRLVTASCLFTHLTINLSPFAFELPSLYLPYVNILKDLGLQDTLSISSAKTLLLNLQKACGYQRLNPNEFRAVMEIVHFICDQANTSNMSSWHSEAVVPDNDCRLVHAKSCVYIDSYGSSYIKFIDISKLRFVHQDLPEKLCIAFGIKKLSDVVIEELYCEEHLQSLEFIGSVPIEAIRHKLLSRPFQAAIWTVVSSMASNVPGIGHATLEDIQSSLKLVAEKLKFVQCLHTRFVLLPKSLDITRVRQESMFPEWKDTSRHRALYFVEPSKASVLIAEPPAYVSIADVIAIAVSRVLDFPIPLPMGSLFLCPEGSETALVDILKLSSHMQALGCRSEKDCLLGRDILPQDALQVQFHPLRPFYAGEIVAWRQQNGEKLRYGRVLENVRPSSGQALYRFKVETSLGLVELLLSSHVFSFKSVTISSEDSSADSLEGYCTMDSTRSEGVTGRVESRPSEGNQQQQLQALQHGRVSAAELVQAVQEMLSAAGISTDMEKQSLLETTITLQEQYKDSQAALLLEQEKSDMATKEADTAKAAWLCRICLNTEVDVTIVPCGHVLCRRCSSAVSRCPFCRLQVSKVMRMFRP